MVLSFFKKRGVLITIGLALLALVLFLFYRQEIANFACDVFLDNKNAVYCGYSKEFGDKDNLKLYTGRLDEVYENRKGDVMMKFSMWSDSSMKRIVKKELLVGNIKEEGYMIGVARQIGSDISPNEVIEAMAIGVREIENYFENNDHLGKRIVVHYDKTLSKATTIQIIENK